MKFFSKNADNDDDSIILDLSKKVEEAHMPSTIGKIAHQELETLAKISPASAEYTIGLTYVEYLTSLPWNKKTVDNLDLGRAERALEENHFGLRKVKERILEHLAIKVLRSSRKPHILVVDDEEVTRKNLAHILSKENCEVAAATNGEEALLKLDAREYDVVITDLRMASVDGMQLLESVKLRHPEAEVIVVTGYASIPSAIEAVKKGASHYIEKPFKLEEVRNAVRQTLENRSRAGSTKGTILCFAGPPGTGKTSVGRAIAQALGRKFARISLGGMKDEADIRGHRRTYVGAKPGRIIDELHRQESANPVIMLDELDKIGHDFKGDPASALLEVLDPEQNRSFSDHYLDVPFDLSSVMFILTANVLETVPAPLRDRMEVIEFSGYSQEDKLEIASRFLIPKQMREKGLAPDQVVFSLEAVEAIIRDYTREAGIRNLERQIATICRKVARECLQSRDRGAGAVRIIPGSLEQYLGVIKYHIDAIEERERVGASTSLVRTEAGGEIIFVEAAMMKGKKELIITGLLGEVMRESAQAALSYIRSNASSYGIPEDFFEHRDIHIHVPRGAIQKDGPSAGLTIVMALLSLLTGRPAHGDVATSGEITLGGRVLPVGGVREKVLAAKRANVRSVVLPAKNRADVEELGEDIRKDIGIRLVNTVAEAVDLVLK